MSRPFAASPTGIALDQILLAVLIFLRTRESIHGSLLRLIDNILLEASIVVVVAYAMDPLVAVRLVLEQIVPWQAVAELVGVGHLVKYHLQDRPDQQPIVSAATDHVGPLCKLIEFLLSELLGWNLLLASKLGRLLADLVRTTSQLFV